MDGKERNVRSLTRPHLSRLVTIVVIFAGASVGLASVAGSASAHCPDPMHNGHRYVAGGYSGGNTDAVRVSIGWISAASQNVCNSGASYSVSIVREPASGSDRGWLQAGWRYYKSFTRPMGYCERMPRQAGTGTYALSEYPVLTERQRYAYVKNSSSQFECRIAGETLRTSATSWLWFHEWKLDASAG